MARFTITTCLTFSSSLIFLLLLSCSLISSQITQLPLTYPPQPDRWELLQSSIGISAMHMQLLHDDTVVIFDRTDFGRSNLTLAGGICRSDPNDAVLQFDCTAHSVLYDVVRNTYRPLMVQTDTWCSSGSVLPNGTLVQTGGYNDGERVVRTFSPCGFDGGCDWVEFPGYLAQRRWYATNQILPDGRVITLGGRRQFNYEFYPRDSIIDSSPSSFRGYRFDFLRETRDGEEENNLYPFLHLLPDGNLFVFANTRSILFDYKRNGVVKEFPLIPRGDPRNYPSSGSSVLLPLQETQNGVVEAEVMVCGGAPKGSFSLAKKNNTFAPAARTCGRLKVSQENPQWEMETMPVPRVMGDMLLLPTGDVIVVNGAESGTAGWENARDPVTRPIIYHPTDRRFSVMSPTPTPRMYHSSAVLLSDGRVLIGGSNPHVYYNFTKVEFPTDLSIEAYSPPYLSPLYSIIRPKILSNVQVLNYGKTFSASFQVVQYLTASFLTVRIVAPSFTTHSFAMNQRMVVLRLLGVMRAGPDSYNITVMGPSTAEIAPAGYYMMFLVHAGVPSSGAWVKVER